MTNLTDEWTREAKHYVKHNMTEELAELGELIAEHWNTHQRGGGGGYVCWEKIWKDVYLHAVYLRRDEIVKMMDEQFAKFDVVTQSGLRPTMTYAKYMPRRPET